MLNPTLLTLPEGKTDFIHWYRDVPGFGLRLRPSKGVWIAQFRIGKQQRRDTIGDTRKVTYAAALKIAKQRFAEVELGIDSKAKQREAAERLTFKAVTKRYLIDKRAKLRTSSYNAPERYLLDHSVAPTQPPHRQHQAQRHCSLTARPDEDTRAHVGTAREDSPRRSIWLGDARRVVRDQPGHRHQRPRRGHQGARPCAQRRRSTHRVERVSG